MIIAGDKSMYITFSAFKDKYGPLIPDPYASCKEDEHWESFHRAKVAASMEASELPFLHVWATDKIGGCWVIRPLRSPDEFDVNPIGNFWVTTKPREELCSEEYIWVCTSVVSATEYVYTVYRTSTPDDDESYVVLEKWFSSREKAELYVRRRLKIELIDNDIQFSGEEAFSIDALQTKLIDDQDWRADRWRIVKGRIQ